MNAGRRFSEPASIARDRNDRTFDCVVVGASVNCGRRSRGSFDRRRSTNASPKTITPGRCGVTGNFVSPGEGRRADATSRSKHEHVVDASSYTLRTTVS